jgi:hypothetical protein
MVKILVWWVHEWRSAVRTPCPSHVLLRCPCLTCGKWSCGCRSEGRCDRTLSSRICKHLKKKTQLILYAVLHNVSLKSSCFGSFLYINANMWRNMMDIYKFRVSRPQISLLWLLTHEQVDGPTQTFRPNSSCNKTVKVRIINISCVFTLRTYVEVKLFAELTWMVNCPPTTNKQWICTYSEYEDAKTIY